ncbi:MAG TPA: hypothetical protein PLQ93_08700, partial [Bacteroidia bacterium]|nr:hypothetical protein [Bacteroidia bacterium]
MLSQAFKAQELSRAEKKKVKMLTREAQAYLDMDDYYMALQYYRQCLAIDPLNERAGTNSAICMQKLAYPVDSTMFLLENLTNSRQPDANFYLALIKHQQRKFDEAILLLQNYRKLKESKRLITDTEVNYRLGLSLNAKEFMAHPGEAHISNMGEAINSKFDDYVPVVNLDESLLYFTSKREGSTGDLLNTDRNFFEDVYCSRKVNGVWQKAENVGPPINSETNDACVALSYDGHSMLVYRTSDDQVSGDLYLSRINDKNQWGELQKLGESINSSFVESSACFSTDSSEIFFSSNRPGGFGGKDIYRIKRLPNQDWSWAYNLGPEVNSAQDEDAPFLHPDGRTLFFSSKGHDCMGNYDVFS